MLREWSQPAYDNGTEKDSPPKNTNENLKPATRHQHPLCLVGLRNIVVALSSAPARVIAQLLALITPFATMSPPRRHSRVIFFPPFVSNRVLAHLSPSMAPGAPPPYHDPESAEYTALVEDEDSDFEALPSYGTIARDHPPNYCTYAICKLRRMSCAPAECCRNQEMWALSRRERADRIENMANARIFVLTLAISALAVTFFMLAIVSGRLLDEMDGKH